MCIRDSTHTHTHTHTHTQINTIATTWKGELLNHVFPWATGNFFSALCVHSPWYNRTGWLGVKHQLTYLLTYFMCGYSVYRLDYIWFLSQGSNQDRTTESVLLADQITSANNYFIAKVRQPCPRFTQYKLTMNYDLTDLSPGNNRQANIAGFFIFYFIIVCLDLRPVQVLCQCYDGVERKTEPVTDHCQWGYRFPVSVSIACFFFSVALHPQRP